MTKTITAFMFIAMVTGCTHYYTENSNFLVLHTVSNHITQSDGLVHFHTSIFTKVNFPAGIIEDFILVIGKHTYPMNTDKFTYSEVSLPKEFVPDGVKYHFLVTYNNRIIKSRDYVLNYECIDQ